MGIGAGLLRLLFFRKRGNTVLILGPPAAGKTTLYLQLRDGITHNGTVASMQENEEQLVLATEKV